MPGDLDQMTRDQLIERAGLIQQARQVHAQRQEAEADPAQYGFKGKLIDTAQALGKAGNVLWPITGAPIGLGLEALTGKKAFSGKEFVDQYNPTNVRGFPSLDTMAGRVGIPAGGELSDVVPGYAKKGENHPWYQPEKGGMLDPTLRGTGAMVTQIGADPATWLTGGMKPAAQVLGKYAVENRGMLAKGLAALLAPGKVAVDAIGTATKMKPLGRAIRDTPYLGTFAHALTNPIGAAATKVGKSFYGHPVLPIVHEGEKSNKSGVSDSLYQAGIMSPSGLQDSAAGARDALGAAAKTLRDKTTITGSMTEAVQPALAEIRKLRGQSATPEAQALADELEQGVLAYIEREKGTAAIPGTPAIPGRPAVRGEKVLEDNVLREVGGSPAIPGRAAIPGTPAVPGLKSTAGRLSNEKSWLYQNDIPQTQWDIARSTAPGQKVEKQLARGLKEQTEKIVEKQTPGAGKALEDINEAYGGLASTKRSQRFVENRYDRQASNARNVTGMDTLLGAGEVGLTGDFKAGAATMALRKALEASRHLTMPGGYALRRLGESNVLDRLNEIINSNSSKKEIPAWQK